MESLNQTGFRRNLRKTTKFSLSAWVGFSLLVWGDAFHSQDYSDAYFPFTLLAFAPLIVLLVAAYTKLKSSPINKFIAAVVFSLCAVISMDIVALSWFFVDGSASNFGFQMKASIILFVALILIYLQLPYKDWGDE